MPGRTSSSGSSCHDCTKWQEPRVSTVVLEQSTGSGRQQDSPHNIADCGETHMRIGIATDHGGYGLKEELLTHLHAAGHEVVDFGAHSLNPSDDYPDFVIPL